MDINEEDILAYKTQDGLQCRDCNDGSSSTIPDDFFMTEETEEGHRYFCNKCRVEITP